MSDSSEDEMYGNQSTSKSNKKFKQAMQKGDEDEAYEEHQDRMMDFVKLQNSMSRKINLGELDVSTRVSHAAANSIKQSRAKDNASNQHVKDKKDRATVEQVLDPRTRVILVKLMNNGLFTEINGCISTGKEANVYHAFTSTKTSLAVKIYKTSILMFKDREKYIQGEFRFRRGYCKSNPRKLIKLWAEKELRNLKRIYQSGIPCPEPLLVKTNILVMEFLGEGMDAAPRLRNAEVTTEQISQIYLDLVLMIRKLYQDCKLIHADLSEYNLLYWKEKLWVIDVSQSIEHDHPQALDFLRRDIYNVNEYFRKNKVRTFSLKSVFDFVTDLNIKDAKSELANLMEMNKDFDPAKSKEEENIFANIYIPRTLEEMDMKHIERDLDKDEELVYSKLTGMNQNNATTGDSEDDEDEDELSEEEEEEEDSSSEEDVKKEKKTKKISKKSATQKDVDDSKKDSEDDEEDDDDSDSDDESESDDEDKEVKKEGDEAEEEKQTKPVLNRKLSDKEANKDRKKKLKEEKKEKRQTKMKKKDKTKLIKRTQAKGKK